MNKIKKLVCIIIAIFTISTSAYAIETSIGASFGIAPAYLRGSDAKSFSSTLETLSGDTEPYIFCYNPSINLMVEVLPFLAIETGIAWESIFITYNNINKYNLNKSQISIPLLLRGQYEYRVGVTYASVGLKFGIPLGEYFLDDSSRYLSIPSMSIKNSNFSMDVSFAIGQEFRLGKANYLGLRIGYNLNVVSSIDKKQFTDIGQEPLSLFIDDINFAVTYRYAFNSKWKK